MITSSTATTTKVRTVRSLTIPRLRFGKGPKRNRPTGYERKETFWSSCRLGSHMPIDAGISWEWNNPLNIIPLFLFALTLIGLVGILL